jgi:hypothetical protein
MINGNTFPSKEMKLVDHHRFDSPTWAVAFLRSFCQLSFSIAKFLQLLTPKVLIADPSGRAD